MKPVFLDTVGLLAVWDESDQWHSVAAAALDNLKKRGAPIVSATFVLLECGNAAARRPYRASADRLRERLEAVQALMAPTEDEWRRAWGLRTTAAKLAIPASWISFPLKSCVG